MRCVVDFCSLNIKANVKKMLLKAKGTAVSPQTQRYPFPSSLDVHSCHCPLCALALTAPTRGDGER